MHFAAVSDLYEHLEPGTSHPPLCLAAVIGIKPPAPAPPQTQSVSILYLYHSTTAADQETELSMLTADAACGWGKVERRRRRRSRRRKGWRENDREGDTQRWDVAALRTGAAWEDLSLTAQVECERGIQMTGMSDCHHQREDM